MDALAFDNLIGSELLRIHGKQTSSRVAGMESNNVL